MGTYFADKEQISRLRMRARVPAQDFVSAQGISTDAGDLLLPQNGEKATGGDGGGGGSKTVTI